MGSFTNTFKFISGLTKSRPYKIDNALFRLHYSVTTPVFMLLSAILWCKQFFGEPIQCSASDFDKEVLNVFCWIHSTFTLPGITEPYYGVGNVVNKDERVFHDYYQWVFIFLVFQGVCFCAPYFLWKSIEGGKLQNLILSLNKPIMEDEAARQKNVKTLARFLYKSQHHHKSYAYFYYFCEILNTLNVVLQICLTNVFLGGEFSGYGLEVMRYHFAKNQTGIINPIVKVFPRMTMCSFYRHGVGGSVQTHDTICVLPMNIFNDKIFIFLWFWFIFLSVLNSLVIIYRVFLLGFSKLRFRAIFRNNKFVDKSQLERVVICAEFGCWFMLNLLSKNVSTLNFVELIEEYTNILDDRILVLKQENVQN